MLQPLRLQVVEDADEDGSVRCLDSGFVLVAGVVAPRSLPMGGKEPLSLWLERRRWAEGEGQHMGVPWGGLGVSLAQRAAA